MTVYIWFQTCFSLLRVQSGTLQGQSSGHVKIPNVEIYDGFWKSEMLNSILPDVSTLHGNTAMTVHLETAIMTGDAESLHVVLSTIFRSVPSLYDRDTARLYSLIVAHILELSWTPRDEDRIVVTPRYYPEDAAILQFRYGEGSAAGLALDAVAQGNFRATLSREVRRVWEYGVAIYDGHCHIKMRTLVRWRCSKQWVEVSAEEVFSEDDMDMDMDN